MYKNILKFIDEAIEHRETMLEVYRNGYERLKAENEQLKKEIEELKTKKGMVSYEQV
jgi:cell division protein FtsB